MGRCAYLGQTAHKVYRPFNKNLGQAGSWQKLFSGFVYSVFAKGNLSIMTIFSEG